MYRMPRMFSRDPDRRKHRADSSSSSSSPPGKPKRLDRRNALKNIDYELSPSTSASPSSYSQEESIRTRSLDLYLGKTSFRVDGVDGEFEIWCRTFGFSGIDDFSILPEEYEAMKVRSASAPAVFSQNFEPTGNHKFEVNCDDDVKCSVDTGGTGSVDVINPKIEGVDMYSGSSENSYDAITKKDEESSDLDRSGDNLLDSGEHSVKASIVVLTDIVNGTLSESRGIGIKGVRPPVLSPPPSVLAPVINKDCLISDRSSEVAPDTDINVSRAARGFCPDEVDESAPKRNVDVEDRRSKVLAEENFIMSVSCSFSTTSNDNDSSSTATGLMSSSSPSGRFMRVIVDWQKGDLLGRGSFGSVYEGIAEDGFFFAVKEVSLLDQGDGANQRILQLEQEISVLSQCEHENIVKYYGTKKDESHLYIFLELINKGSLLSLYQKYDLRVSQVSAYTRQILHGLRYLHNKNVIHRDIKCANILVATNGSVKLADFGLAKFTKLNDVKSCKGTAFWMAPEVVLSRGYGPAADIWSLGCTVLEMLTRRFPYSHLDNQMAALYRIGRGERPPIPDSVSSDARDFILACLQVDPSLRPTATQLMDHPFVKRSLTSFSAAPSPHRQI